MTRTGEQHGALEEPFPIFELLSKMIASYERYAIAWRAELDLTGNEHLILQELLLSGPFTSADLARRIGITTASMTVIIAGLERKQLIRRVPDTADRRRILVYASKTAVSRSAHFAAAVATELEASAGAFDRSARRELESFLRQAEEIYRNHSRQSAP